MFYRRRAKGILAAGGIAAMILSVMTVGTGTRPAGARQDVPAPTPDVPRPAACRVEPRPLPLFPAATPGAEPAATPAPLVTPTPFAAPEGQPADEATVTAVTATIRESLACLHAGDYRRAYALFTDRFLRQLFGGPDTIDPAIAAALEAPPRRVPRNQRLTLVAVSDVRLLADGRVGAVVQTRNPLETFADYLILIRPDDRWLIDERVFLSDAALSTRTP